ncbi:uncharacterized protein LOC114576246 [Exaiptasia diaphana]|uniref:Uncharacterized protein n=1 Tax=Exaiptasia diaphana TaxID=2652724 RepID=A0A913YT07_EXADI|nr:uncharacterized protein LOC114576246 [Exaiptasia diaphana]
MENYCSFYSIVNTSCSSYNRREKNSEATSIPLLNCTKDISSHKSSLAFSGVYNEKDLILLRSGLFGVDLHKQKQLIICSFHRSTLGIGWVRTSTKCSVPRSVARHKRKSVKGDRGISAKTSALIYEMTATLIPVGSGICRKCRDHFESIPSKEENDEDFQSMTSALGQMGLVS